MGCPFSMKNTKPQREIPHCGLVLYVISFYPGQIPVFLLPETAGSEHAGLFHCLLMEDLE